jgi:L-ribulose-5-phosphate 4-epimerase
MDRMDRKSITPPRKRENLKMNFNEMRTEVYDTTMLLCENGLIRLSAGNISVQDGAGHVAITPAGLRYDQMRPEDIPILTLDGDPVEGDLKPSSEVPMHTAVFRAMPEVRGVVHTHSVYAIGLASAGVDLPLTCIEVFLIGGPVPVAPYACPGTAEAGKHAVDLFRAQPGLASIMLRNHGLISIGKSLYDAYQASYMFEIGAQVYDIASRHGEPVALNQDQIDEIRRVYKIPAPKPE